MPDKTVVVGNEELGAAARCELEWQSVDSIERLTTGEMPSYRERGWYVLAQEVARLYPPDDGDGVTPEWIKSILPESPGIFGSSFHRGIFGRIDWFQYSNGMFVTWLNGEYLNHSVMSKGAFRRLCAGIGVELVEVI